MKSENAVAASSLSRSFGAVRAVESVDLQNFVEASGISLSFIHSLKQSGLTQRKRQPLNRR